MSTSKRAYYSIRSGRHPSRGQLTLSDVKEQILATYEGFEQECYFQEAFGYYCVDAGQVHGKAGSNIGAFFFKKLKKKDLWPLQGSLEAYSEDDLFDVIELLFDCVSQPTEGYHHDYSNCGYHYREFDKAAGQDKFRTEINETITSYGEGFELSSEGEISELAPPGLANLEAEPLPEYDKGNVNDRVAEAIKKFRSRKSSISDQRDAVVGLANVLEYLKPKLKKVLDSKDENDLFNIANNFGLRHHTSKQKTNYDEDVWFNWIFYHYLATIHTALRLIKRREQ